MDYRLLGRTGVSVSPLCLGSMMFGPWGNDDRQESIRIIHRALDAGINFVDTADVYSAGESEEIVGEALSGGRRDNVVLATKFFVPMSEDPNERGGSRRWIMREVENSLRRLKTDHIDLYQVHRPSPDTDVEETLGALSDLVHQGKVRYIGSSSYAASQIVEAQWAARERNLQRFVTEQPPYSLLVRGIEQDVLPTARRHGMGVLTYSPLAGGWLSGRWRKDSDTPTPASPARRRLAKRFDMSLPENQRKLDVVESLTQLADEAGMTLIELAIACTINHPAVTSAIIGPRTLEQLESQLPRPTARSPSRCSTASTRSFRPERPSTPPTTATAPPNSPPRPDGADPLTSATAVPYSGSFHGGTEMTVPNLSLNNGVEIPAIGFGVFQTPPDQTVAAVESALSTGYRQIDTAAAYGNEREVGQAIRRFGLDRSEVFVETKIWISDYGYDDTLHAFDKAAGKLGIDQIDLLILHQALPSDFDRTIAAYTALETLLADGKVRAIGVSNFMPDHLRRLMAETGVVPAVNQIEVHPYFRQSELLAFNAEHGILNQAWAPIGGITFYREGSKGSTLQDPVINEVAQAHGKTPAQVMLRWHLQQDRQVIPKSVTPSRIAENFDVFDFDLTVDQLSAIDALDTGIRGGPEPQDITRQNFWVDIPEA